MNKFKSGDKIKFSERCLFKGHTGYIDAFVPNKQSYVVSLEGYYNGMGVVVCHESFIELYVSPVLKRREYTLAELQTTAPLGSYATVSANATQHKDASIHVGLDMNKNRMLAYDYDLKPYDVIDMLSHDTWKSCKFHLVKEIPHLRFETKLTARF